MTREDRKDAAVSETLGYILLFAIVTLSMGVIYAIGYPALQSSIDTNIFESAEQNFIVLQSNMDRVAFDQTPVKVHKMKLQSSMITVSNDSSMTITYDSDPPLHIPTGEIEFEKDGKTVAYEMGSVFKTYTSGSALMVSKPPIYNSSIDNKDITTIGLVSVNGDTGMSGKGIVTLTLRHNDSRMDMTPSPINLTVQINSTHASKWGEYLESMGFTVAYPTSSSVTAQKNDTMVILSRHEVDVTIS
ncbi:MAG: hypothetical protein RBT65_08545 [Methanolobus sp.]|jgi:hypothetical protein|nr:hypothetical protein [Methanolobus sp.]